MRLIVFPGGWRRSIISKSDSCIRNEDRLPLVSPAHCREILNALLHFKLELQAYIVVSSRIQSYRSILISSIMQYRSILISSIVQFSQVVSFNFHSNLRINQHRDHQNRVSRQKAWISEIHCRKSIVVSFNSHSIKRGNRLNPFIFVRTLGVVRSSCVFSLVLQNYTFIW